MIKKIAIVRLSALGDIIHTVPAVWRIKKKLPDVEITWFIERGNEKLLECFTPFVKIQTVALKKKGLIKIIQEIKKLTKQYNRKFDLVIDFQGLIKSSFLSFILGKKRLGFHKKNLREGIATFLYNKSLSQINEFEHVIKKNIHLANYTLSTFFNIDKVDIKIEYPPQEKYKSNKVMNFISDNNLEVNNYFIINVGGGWETKLLNFIQHVKIINAIKKKYAIVILWGNEKERILAKQISEKTNTIMIDFLKFDELFQFIELSACIITADTLALHIADVVNTKSIGIFGPTSPKRNGSLNPASKSVYKNLPCSPCHKKQCKSLQCIKEISTKEILKEISL